MCRRRTHASSTSTSTSLSLQSYHRFHFFFVFLFVDPCDLYCLVLCVGASLHVLSVITVGVSTLQAGALYFSVSVISTASAGWCDKDALGSCWLWVWVKHLVLTVTVWRHLKFDPRRWTSVEWGWQQRRPLSNGLLRWEITWYYSLRIALMGNSIMATHVTLRGRWLVSSRCVTRRGNRLINPLIFIKFNYLCPRKTCSLSVCYWCHILPGTFFGHAIGATAYITGTRVVYIWDKGSSSHNIHMTRIWRFLYVNSMQFLTLLRCPLGRVSSVLSRIVPYLPTAVMIASASNSGGTFPIRTTRWPCVAGLIRILNISPVPCTFIASQYQ